MGILKIWDNFLGPCAICDYLASTKKMGVFFNSGPLLGPCGKHKVNFADFRLIYSYDLVVPAYIAIFRWIPALTVTHSDSHPSQVQVAQLTNTNTSRLSKAISYGRSTLNDSNSRLP